MPLKPDIRFQRITLVVGYDAKREDSPDTWDWPTTLDPLGITGVKVVEAVDEFDAGMLEGATPVNVHAPDAFYEGEQSNVRAAKL